MLRWTLRRLREGTPDVRSEAAWQLGHSRELRALEALTESLRSDPDKRVRVAAAHALEKLKDPRGVPALTAVLATNAAGHPVDSYVLYAVIDALVAIGDSRAVATLVDLVERAHVSLFTKFHAVKALGYLRDERATPTLLGILARLDWRSGPHDNRFYDLEKDLAKDAMIALQKIGFDRIGDVSAIEPLVNTLTADDYSIRKRAASALGALGSKKGIPPLAESMIHEDCHSIRSTMLEALTKIDACWTRSIEDAPRYFSRLVENLKIFNGPKFYKDNDDKFNERAQKLFDTITYLALFMEQSVDRCDVSDLRRLCEHEQVYFSKVELVSWGERDLHEEVIVNDRILLDPGPLTHPKELARQELLRRGG